MKTIAVIGGGASGLMAACHAAKSDRQVLIFEKQKKIGSKILVTGNGRCNISNSNLTADHFHGGSRQFVEKILNTFGLEHTTKYFSSIGIPFSEEKEGRLYPTSLQASVVVRFFEFELQRQGISCHLHRRIDSIIPTGRRFKIITAGREEYIVDSVILSCGSCAYPSVGASRIGYELAQSLGHRIIEPFPAIVPLNIPLKILHRLQGIKWHCTLKVLLSSKCVHIATGEILFTAYGISGPVALDISRFVNNYVVLGKIPSIVIDLFPNVDGEAVVKLIRSVLVDGERPIGFAILGILRQHMSEVICIIAGVDPNKPVASCTSDDIYKLSTTLKCLTITPGVPRGFQEAVVAAGGVDTGQINPNSMESTIVPGLFITGELLNIDGDSGGYNLQFAWSTGAIAGMNQ